MHYEFYMKSAGRDYKCEKTIENIVEIIILRLDQNYVYRVLLSGEK